MLTNGSLGFRSPLADDAGIREVERAFPIAKTCAANGFQLLRKEVLADNRALFEATVSSLPGCQQSHQAEQGSGG